MIGSIEFNNLEQADIFREWLINNQADRDYGYPKLISRQGTRVHYSTEHSDFIFGLAAGIKLAQEKSCT